MPSPAIAPIDAASSVKSIRITPEPASIPTAVIVKDPGTMLPIIAKDSVMDISMVINSADFGLACNQAVKGSI